MKRFTPFLVPLFLLAAGCAGSALRPDDTQQQEIQALKARILELQREAAMNQVELAQLRQQMAGIEGRGGGGARPAAPAPEIRREPAAVVVEPIEEVDIDLPESAPQPPPRRTPPPAAVKPAPAGRADEAPSEVISPANQVLYDRGYTLFHQGRFVDAEASFQRFLQANPESELADNAQYWIGECRYSRNDMKGALAAFRETIERFPKGNKVADAMLKAGQCLEAMGDIEGARVTYREVARRFTGTAAAAVAEERRGKLP